LQHRLDRHAAAIAVSQPVVEAYAQYFRAHWDIIPNGVDTSFFRPGDPDARRDDGPQLLFLGRLDPRNGLDTILAAMPAILTSFPDARLTVAGDGPLRPFYERMAAGIAPHVTFLGRVNGERPRYYSSADLYLCPTTKASFGVTLLEAMACGTPMAVSDITGFRELVSGGEEAVLVPKNDPEAWARTVIDLLADDGRRQMMARAGLLKSAQFAWPRVAEQVLKVYDRLGKC
jgi:phosphatidylinositol alpha-mannosyltransferase